MATDRHTAKTYLNDEEKERLETLASQMKISGSELLRRLLTNSRLPSARDFGASKGIVDILRVNADQARLGNLLKLAMDEPISADLLNRFDRLASEIQSTQDLLKQIANDIHVSIGRPR